MNTALINSNNDSQVQALFKYTIATVAIHLMFASLVVRFTWTVLDTQAIYYGMGTIFGAVVVHLICHHLYKSKDDSKSQSAEKWGNVLVVPMLITCSVLATAYYFSLTTATTNMWPIISLVAVMHLVSVVITNLASKRVILAAVIPSSGALTTGLIVIGQPSSYALATGILVFSVVLVTFAFSLSRSLAQSFQVKEKYDELLIQNDIYKTKVETATFEDPKTGIFNRRVFDLIISEEVRRAKRINGTLSVIMIQIDCFAEYQQHYSPEQTDECINSVAKLLSKASSRGGEFMTRFDEATFALVVPNATAEQAYAFSEKMSDLVNKAKFEHLHSNIGDLTTISISVGISEFTQGSIIDLEELVMQSMSALSHAQQHGGNKVTTFDHDLMPDQATTEDAIKSVEFDSTSRVA